MQAIREARRELDAVIDEIRTVPGYEAFLAAPTFDDVAEAAADRPIAYIAAAETGGLALVVRGRDVTHVPLDELGAEPLRERVVPYLEAYSAYRLDPKAAVAAWERALDETCAWLWEAAVGPVLEGIDRGGELTLVAGGLLGLLPLHAAWRDDPSAATGRRYALDDAVLSYAPNARAVSAARELASAATGTGALVVADPRPVSAPPLRWAGVEGRIAAAAAAPGLGSVLEGGEATVGAFGRKAGSAGLLHLACHGVADLDAPLESGLLMAGNRWLTLRDLLTMKLRVRLAVLSACETSLPGTELPDEVVALPTGLLQAGVAGVIASQWAVPDLATTVLMADFYRRHRTASPGAALRAAQRWVRDTTNGEKVDELEQALAGHEDWLPEEAGRALVAWLSLRRPDARSEEKIHTWGAFTHVGV